MKMAARQQSGLTRRCLQAIDSDRADAARDLARLERYSPTQPWLTGRIRVPPAISTYQSPRHRHTQARSSLTQLLLATPSCSADLSQGLPPITACANLMARFAVVAAIVALLAVTAAAQAPGVAPRMAPLPAPPARSPATAPAPVATPPTAASPSPLASPPAPPTDAPTDAPSAMPPSVVSGTPEGAPAAAPSGTPASSAVYTSSVSFVAVAGAVAAAIVF
ncbi:classical arabinogalactan protein 10-like [Triticum urartu]|uniref:classical arabinogalactan protein 10-like n=1 Tax=Triticum urartu TaxID=4572 RepID=UPI002043E967|nr:classical arabinogalactan protein 10-like [Triticum urartu]